MNPGVILLVLGGHVVMLAGLLWLVFRLGGFTPSARERRSWAISAGLLVAWVLLLALIGPLPLPVVIAMDVLVLAWWVWAWRTGRLSIERAPTDLQAEVKRRRQWGRQHWRLLIGLAAAYSVATLAWVFAVALFLLPSGPR